ncbi:hypothetical protein B0J15DRAFT_547961 [Fusarium solani]|jgi:hypothetical protein|uniref:Uncharacterized protein n=1 Tax=Fusarium solani TaxID=169388 RepID=A0A9P9HNR5_FUSSL|nr:uncharacterized protein B0J15DRAFT_547961 [Fusarium solani]KAH7260363.1 hypothetical protein B0J15DRAFT_547961 [Fusarium solani]
MTSTMEEFEAAHSEISWCDLLPYMGVWTPDTAAVFENFENANFFGRFNTWHSAQEIREAIEATTWVDHSFCLFLDSSIFVFSGTREDHSRHMNQVWWMLDGLLMGHDHFSCVCFAPMSIRAGFTIDPLGRAFIVTDVGAFIKDNGRGHTREEN